MGSIEQQKLFTALVVGAGIGGLSAAIALSRNGVDVTILESKPELNEFGASIGISPYTVKVIRAYGLGEQFKSFVTENRCLEMRTGKDNEVLGAIYQNEANTCDILYGAPAWNIHRADYQQLLAKGALSYGAKILFNASVERVDVDRNSVHLKDGRELTADLIVGADGLNSLVRRNIPATASAELTPLGEKAYRCTVDKDLMRSNPNLAWLLENNNVQMWVFDGRYILSWPMPENKPYDVVICVGREGCDVPYGHWGIRADPKEVAAEFGDACDTVKDLVANIGPCVQWRLADLPPLETCRSERGGIVLLGDAWHAMVPHAGSGGSSAIEDGAVLGECIGWAWKHHRSIAEGTKAYETLRKPRVERLQEVSREGVGYLDGSKVELRKMMMAKQAEMQKEFLRPEADRRADLKPTADMHAPYMSLPYAQWLNGYDTFKETHAYLATL